MTADAKTLTQLLEESQDLQADAIRPPHSGLDELVESSHSSRNEDTTASIEPVEMQHIAILYYVMGVYPGSQTTAGSPIAFSSTSAAA